MRSRALAVTMLASLTAPSGVLAFCQPKTEYCVPPIDCEERPQVPCFEKPPPDELQNIDRIVKLTIEQLEADHAVPKAVASRLPCALAYNWIRILCRCSHDRTPYDESKYLEALRRKGSPLPKYLADAI